MKIAVCNDIAEFGGNRLADPRWASRFPGAGWVSEFVRRAAARGWEVTSGDIALSHVQCAYWKASDVHVIQELDSVWASRLLEVGCRPLLLTCLESPLYASLFFDRWHELAAAFPHFMIPLAPAERVKLVGAKGWQLRFPCFWQGQRRSPVPWQDRQNVVLVATNKYWSHEDKTHTPPLTTPRSYLKWLIQALHAKMSSTRRKAQRLQLHDARLESIVALSQHQVLALYGSGWDELVVLPLVWQRRLGAISLPYFGRVKDKIALQAGFRFAICFENVSTHGYVTEKIIEALVAGAIPVYLGAPDIALHVPSAAYIDASRLSSMNQLPELLRNISTQDAVAMLEAGQLFLDSEIGQLHSYEGFAEWVERLALEASVVV